ncbi:MAG: chemotaxis protein CheR [Deinococcus-Thermus bacterium]|nr:chemotaxis protein CheR [Deinococcota bacterium]
MKPDDFTLFQTLLKQRSGLVVTPDKAYLLESRLMPVARRWNLKSLDEVAQTLRQRRDEQLARDITEAMTTNESSFFRDVRPFDQFRDVVLPEIMAKRASQRRLRIWSAACSSGQEPYSLAMLLQENKPLVAGWTIEIVGTDLSSEILAKAKAGVYTQFEVQRGLPITHLVKYFTQNGDKWHISPEIKRMVTFKEGNLLTDLGGLGQFDIVFCRNVLIYFDQPTKGQVLERISRIMPEDGVLFLGGAETVLGITEKFKPMEGQRGIYRLSQGSGGARATTPAAGGYGLRRAG